MMSHRRVPSSWLPHSPDACSCVTRNATQAARKQSATDQTRLDMIALFEEQRVGMQREMDVLR